MPLRSQPAPTDLKAAPRDLPEAALWQPPRWAIRPYLWLLLPSALFIALFFALPFGTVLVSSLQHGPLHPQAGKFTLMNYWRFLRDGYYWLVVGRTFGLGLAIAAICVVLGYPCAYAIARTHSRLKALYIFLIIAPLVTSIVIRSYAWIVLLGQKGILNTLLLEHGVVERPFHLIYNWTGVIIAMTHVLLPYSILSIASVLETIDPRVEEAARVLGANRWRTFWWITVPLSIEGVGTAAILVFMLGIGSFVTVWLLGGSGTTVLSLLIYQQITVAFDSSFAAVLGTFLVVSSIFILYGGARYFRVRGRTDAAH